MSIEAKKLITVTERLLKVIADSQINIMNQNSLTNPEMLATFGSHSKAKNIGWSLKFLMIQLHARYQLFILAALVAKCIR